MSSPVCRELQTKRCSLQPLIHLSHLSHARPTSKADPRLQGCLKFDPLLDDPARKPTHWTLRDQGDGDAGRGDGGA